MSVLRAFRYKLTNETGENVTPIPLSYGSGTQVKEISIFDTIDNGDESFDPSNKISLFERNWGTGSVWCKRTSVDGAEGNVEGFIRKQWNSPEKGIVRLTIVKDGKKSDTLNITLTETDFTEMIDIPSTKLPQDDHEANAVLENNKKYQFLCDMRVGSSRYGEKCMQTINDPLKSKHCQTIPIVMLQKSEHVTKWMIHDELDISPAKAYDSKHADVTGEMPAFRLSANSSKHNISAINFFEPIILKRLRATTDAVENILCLTHYKALLSRYREIQSFSTTPIKQSVSTDLDRGDTISDLSLSKNVILKHYWTYCYPQLKGYSVTSICINRSKQDAIAATYAVPGFSDNRGIVCCWSLQNVENPFRVFHLPFGVTSCHFASDVPAQLAVGCNDGSIAIYLVNRNKQKKQLLADSLSSNQRHVGTLNCLRFVPVERAGQERTEVLVSTSQDGFVRQWTLQRNLRAVNIMQLSGDLIQRQSRNSGSAKGVSASNAVRLTPGLCIDFHSSDSTRYLVSTEAGTIHLCSSMRTEEYVASYIGHSAPVCRVQWSPFLDKVFISGSYDWTVKIWHVDQDQCVISVESTNQEAILDVQWSPHCATQFAFCCTHHIEIWDIAVSLLDPRIVHMNGPGDPNLTTLVFTTNSNCLLVGNSAGSIRVYQLAGTEGVSIATQDEPFSTWSQSDSEESMAHHSDNELSQSHEPLPEQPVQYGVIPNNIDPRSQQPTVSLQHPVLDHAEILTRIVETKMRKHLSFSK